MKKLTFFLLTFVMLICVSASCFANQPYKHPDYDLRTVKEIHITLIDNLEGKPSHHFKSDENAEAKVLAAVLQAAGKQKLIAADETQKPLPEYNNDKNNGRKTFAPRDLEMRITVNHCGYSVVAVPGHFEDYTTQERHYYYDKEGKRHYWTEDVVRQRWVPESFHPYAQLSLIYNFYDMEDGTLVASFSDSRNREYENDPAGGMLNRSLKDCFKKIFRK